MRELKFRVFNTRKNEMIFPDNDGYFDGAYLGENGYYQSTANIIAIQKAPDSILMQYTGLKDKNGVEIYEGDIVTLNTLTEPVRGKGTYWVNKIFTVTYGGQCFLPYCLDDSTVIGNIYENPELLGEDNE